MHGLVSNILLFGISFQFSKIKLYLLYLFPGFSQFLIFIECSSPEILCCLMVKITWYLIPNYFAIFILNFGIVFNP